MKTTKQQIFEGYLAGVAYSDYQRVAGIRAGREVKFYWEQSNPHDKMAVKVTLDGVHIGYIPKEHTYMFHGQREQKRKVYGEIVSYNHSNPSWKQIVVRAWVNEEIPVDVAL